ncbi:hypothetical protein D3C81_2340660 [compost metagenome]
MQRLNLAAECFFLLDEYNVGPYAGFPVILADVKSGAEAAEASADNDYFTG